MTVTTDASLSALRAVVRGDLIDSDHAGYDEARRVYNGMIDRRPAVIARCADAADVIAALDHARRRRMLVAIRGGGHNGAGLGTCDGGIVLDLSAMRGVRVDPAQQTARVGAGCTWAEVDHATHAFGLAVPSGIISSTGVGGLTLGGSTARRAGFHRTRPPGRTATRDGRR